MSTITARFQGSCCVCGGRIHVGDSIEYIKGSPVRHTLCKRIEPPADAIRLSGGSGYGCTGWVPKSVIHSSKDRIEKGGPEWLYVLEASKRYVHDDGMSFGVGDEEGYLYSAVCRPATPEESAPKVLELKAEEARLEAGARLREIFDVIQKTGERPTETSNPEGVRVDIGAGQTIYGGGRWMIVGTEWIWAIRNNGSDGDDWSNNNIRTGGAGAIGWRVKFDSAMALEIEACARGAV